MDLGTRLSGFHTHQISWVSTHKALSAIPNHIMIRLTQCRRTYIRSFPHLSSSHHIQSFPCLCLVVSSSCHIQVMLIFCSRTAVLFFFSFFTLLFLDLFLFYFLLWLATTKIFTQIQKVQCMKKNVIIVPRAVHSPLQGALHKYDTLHLITSHLVLLSLQGLHVNKIK